MAHFRTRSGTQNEDGSWTYSLQSCKDQFLEEYPDLIISQERFANHKTYLLNVLQRNPAFANCKGKSTGRPTVLSEVVMNDIEQRINRSSTKSVSKLTAQTGNVILICQYI